MVEGAEADAHLLGVFGIAREELRTALAAEALLKAALGMTPTLDQVRTSE